MSAMMSLAKRRASMVVGDFDFTNNGAPLTALPAILTALNATYTRNSAKNVVQNGALVTLSANQFGTSYDPVAGAHGYVPEPAATNLCTNSDGNASTYTVSNVSDGTAVPGFTNGLAFGDNSVQRFAYKKVALTAAATYSVSVFVIMDDGNAPVVGTSTTTGDMRFVIDGFGVSSTALVERLGSSNVYRISASATAPTGGASRDCGVIKYTGQSARTFRVTGIQVETGLRATSYIATTGSTASRSADALTVPLWVNNLLNSVFAGGGAAPTSWTRPFATGSSAPEASGLYAGETAYLQSGTAQRPFLSQDFSAQANTTYTLSMIVESVTGSINAQNALLQNNALAGSVTTYPVCEANPSGGPGGIITTGKLVVHLSVSNASGTVNCRMGLGCSGSTTGTLKFLRPQIEAGSTATAYRPTTSTLESAANANITGFSSAGYTLFADFRSDVLTSATRGLIEVSDNASTNRSGLGVIASGGLTVYSNTGGSSQANFTGGNFATSRGKASGSYKVDSFKAAANGSGLTEDTSGTMPSGAFVLSIGCIFTGSIGFNGFLFRAQLIPQALTQAQINGMTT